LETTEFELKEKLKDEEFKILSYYGDKKPHALYQQFFWLKSLYKKMKSSEFTEMIRKFCEYDILMPFGNDYSKINFTDREHILTDKGDKILREILINRNASSNVIRGHIRK